MAILANIKKFVKSLQVICTRDSAKVLNPSLCLFYSTNYEFFKEFYYAMLFLEEELKSKYTKECSNNSLSKKHFEIRETGFLVLGFEFVNRLN